jgi:hypothetical protein
MDGVGITRDDCRNAGRHQHLDGIPVVVQRRSDDACPGASPQRKRRDPLVDLLFDLADVVAYGHFMDSAPTMRR